MRYAFIADIHANLEALRAVWAELGKLAPDATFCLGDIVGYGADPAECLAEVRERTLPTVAGNHDLAACGVLSAYLFNSDAQDSLMWTREALSAEDRAYLGTPAVSHQEGLV